MQAAVLLVLLVGCFAPVVPTGVPCSTAGECPQGQMCDRGRNLCGAPPIDASSFDDGGTDAPVDTPLIDAAPLGAWGPVLPLTDLNTTSLDSDPAISSDGLELFFASNRPGALGGLGDQDIFVARRADLTLAFGAPTVVTELSTPQVDLGPCLTADGLTIYLARGGDIYRATRPNRTSPFAPAVLDAALSSASSDINPSISPDGLTATVTRELTSEDRDLYLYTRSSVGAEWSAGMVMTMLQTSVTDSGAEFTTDPLELYFHSNRLGGAGTDIFRATRSSIALPFGSPTRVDELNTGQNETDPSITADRRLIVFSRQGDLVYATR